MYMINWRYDIRVFSSAKMSVNDGNVSKADLGD